MNETGSRVTFETLTLRGTPIGEKSTLPPLRSMVNVQTRPRLHEFDGEEVYVGYGNVPTSLPYLQQNRYSRDLEEQTHTAAVVENTHIRAVFLPELGGKLWRLIDKDTGTDLVYANDVIRPCNLAICNAWTSGGVEWNVGMVGHSPFTCSPLHTAVLEEETPEGSMQVLRMYEFERIRRIVYQMDFYIPPRGRFLHARMSLYNPWDAVLPMYWWSNIAVPEEETARVIVPAQRAYVYENNGLGKQPVQGDWDASYPVRTPAARDYYLVIP